jgi:beta-phosphoglucomutase-like phosphatase (HAD superfamily)
MKNHGKYFMNPVLEGYLEKTDVMVFDLNGLIVDDEPLQLIAHNAGIAAYYKDKRPNETPPQISDKDWGEKCVGRHPQDWLPIIVVRPLDEGERDAVKRVKDGEFFKLVGDRIHEIVRPGVLDLIKYLFDKGVPLALATSSSPEFVEKALGKKGLKVLPCFEFRLCGDMVGKKKPDPEIYNRVRTHFGETLHYLVFEDAESGILSAKGAGMNCIAVPNRYTLLQDLSKADAIIDTLRPDAAFIQPTQPGRVIPKGPKKTSQP